MVRLRGKFSFYQWLAASLLIHAVIVLPFIFGTLRMPDNNRRSKLVVELYGMISNRQAEEKHKAATVVRQPKRVERQAPPRPKPDKQQPKEPERPVKPDTPVPAQRPDDRQYAAGQNASASVIYKMAGSDDEQKGQSIRHAEREGDKLAARIQEYVGKMAKRMYSVLVYPPEVRRNGIEGVSTIAFIITESGAIKEGSLRVRRSSGYAALDSSALKSALASTPFEKPPKEMPIVIAISFNVEAARSAARNAAVR